MNSNRSQYTTAPAYGIQKKGYAKKMGFTEEKNKYLPDFDAYPAQNTQANVWAQQAPTAPDFSASPGFDASSQQYVPYASPPASIQSSNFSYTPRQNGQQQVPVQAQQNTWGYSQTPQNYPWYQIPQPKQNPWPSNQPVQQNQGGVPPEYWNAYSSASGTQYTQPRQAFPAQPVSSAPQETQPQTPPPPIQRSPKTPASKKMSVNQLMTLFLYGILPILFIISFFRVSFFYAFIALAVVGVGALWYREMYAKPVRYIVTGLFAILCVIGVVKIMRAPNNSSSTLGTVPVTNAQVVVTMDPQYLSTDSPDLLATPVPATPAPTAAISEAERRLSSFMDLWATSNAEAMVELVQPSWVSKQSNPAQALFNLLANRKAESYEFESITGTESDTSRAVTMTALINKNAGKKKVTYRFTIMMVKEGDQWYVNPNSLATNDEVTTTEDEVVVNDSNSKGLATEAPRVTVSPVPPGSTLLYYNPDGGSYYHLDANCPSVRSEFLPLSGSFTYAELGNYRSRLSPCIRCNAPSNTLAPDAQ